MKDIFFSTDWRASCASRDETLFSPVMAGLPVGSASALAILPIHDANGQMLESVSDLRNRSGNPCVGILAIAPLRGWTRILHDLRERKVDRIFTWPSVAIFDEDMQEDLVPYGLTFEREVAFVQEAINQGFHTTATVFDSNQAARMVAAGASRILLHPPLPKEGERWLDRKMRDWIGAQIKLIGSMNVPVLTYVEGTAACAEFDCGIARYRS